MGSKIGHFVMFYVIAIHLPLFFEFIFYFFINFYCFFRQGRVNKLFHLLHSPAHAATIYIKNKFNLSTK